MMVLVDDAGLNEVKRCFSAVAKEKALYVAQWRYSALRTGASRSCCTPSLMNFLFVFLSQAYDAPATAWKEMKGRRLQNLGELLKNNRSGMNKIRSRFQQLQLQCVI